MRDGGNRRLIEWHLATKPRGGEESSGDLALVTFRLGGALVAAVDGVGHGPEAARAARIAVDVLHEFADEEPVALLRRCHEALRESRGVAISVAAVSTLEGTMTWLGVGSVEGRLVRGDGSARPSSESLLLLRGLPGRELPPLTTSTVRVRRGDLVILATDGISTNFADSLDASGSSREIADRILADHAKGTDDSLVLVARYLGNHA